jgi:hypothetical protein
MTAQQSPAGWYADPSGDPGQKYWDGQNWQQAAVPQPAVDQQVIRAAMAENRSIWVTNGLAAWSLVIGAIGFLMNFLFGAGVFFGGIGGVIALVAFNKSKTLNGQGRGLSIASLVLNGLVVAFGLIVWVILLAAAGSGGS